MRSLFFAALPVLMIASGAFKAQSKEQQGKEFMNYSVEEISYGPDIRQRDWGVLSGKTQAGGGCLHLLSRGKPAKVLLLEPDFPGGGDVERSISFDVDKSNSASKITLHFGVPKYGKSAGHGFLIILDSATIEVILGDKSIAKEKYDGFACNRKYTFKIATLGARYRVWYNNTVIAEGESSFPFTHNEGSVSVTVDNAEARLLAYTEAFIAPPKAPVAWRRDKLLYEETFSKESLAKNWIYRSENALKPEVTKEGFVIHGYRSNLFLFKRFKAPMAMDCIVRPIPLLDDKRWPSQVTDVIIYWFIDKPGGRVSRADLMANKGGQPMDLSLYWVDFGGTNNVTTRFRKNPGRHLIRQFADRKRLLQRNHIYRLTVVQNHGFIEFWVDGVPWLRHYDENALTAGHVGFRAYSAGLEIRECKVWSLKDADGKVK